MLHRGRLQPSEPGRLSRGVSHQEGVENPRRVLWAVCSTKAASRHRSGQRGRGAQSCRDRPGGVSRLTQLAWPVADKNRVLVGWQPCRKARLESMSGHVFGTVSTVAQYLRLSSRIPCPYYAVGESPFGRVLPRDDWPEVRCTSPDEYRRMALQRASLARTTERLRLIPPTPRLRVPEPTSRSNSREPKVPL